MIRVYLNVALMECLSHLEYRLNLLVGPLSIILSVGVNIFLWHLIMVSNGLTTVQGMTLQNFAFYFILTTIILQVRSNWDLNFELVDDIRKGLVTRFLTRPVSLYWNTFAVWIGRNSGFYLLYTISFIVLAVLFPHQLFQNTWQIPLFILALVISVFLSHAIHMNIIVLNFWLDDVTGLILGYNFFSVIISGTLIPYSFFPDQLKRGLELSPFAHLVSTPTLIAQGKVTPWDALVLSGQGILWTFLVGGIFSIVYRRAIRAYGAYGG